MSYTPGPWEAILDDDPRRQPSPFYRGIVALVERSPDRTVAVVSKARDTVSKDEWLANAQIIADAPEMREKLLRIAAIVNAFHNGPNMEGLSRCQSALMAVQAVGDVLGEPF